MLNAASVLSILANGGKGGRKGKGQFNLTKECTSGPTRCMQNFRQAKKQPSLLKGEYDES